MPDALNTTHPLVKFCNIRDTAAHFGLSVALFRKLSRLPDFPVLRCGRACRYDLESVRAYFESRANREAK